MDKLTYNHYDSYPEWLGAHIVEFVKESSVEELNAIYDGLILIDGSSVPDEAQIEECSLWTDTLVSKGSTSDWYCLLRKAQGEFQSFHDGLRYMIDNHNFIKDSLFCEFGYIINLDDNALEFWKGDQEVPQKGNRYGTECSEDGYYPCRFALSFPLSSIPKDAVKQMKRNSK